MSVRLFNRFDRSRVVAGITIIFHAVGLVGIGILHNEGIRRSTPLHLLLMTGLLCLAAAAQGKRFALWAAVTAVVSIGAEWVGVHTGLLFGAYSYGAGLGPRVDGVPLLIGANWIIIVAGATSAAQGLSRKPWLVVLLAALLATAVDWLLEPVAIRLHWWTWEGGGVPPVLNYVCWAGLAALLAGLWVALRLRPVGFAVFLILVQAVFFAALRLLLY